MPELPEVQTTANGLNTVLPGLTITDVWTDYGGAFHAGKDHIKNTGYFPGFKKQLVGRSFERAGRRGKNVVLTLSGNLSIIIHMKMTGHVMHGKYARAEKRGKSGAAGKNASDNGTWLATEPGPLQDPFNQFLHLVISLSNGSSLVLSDMRKFAKVFATPTDKLAEHPDLAHLGPEPLEPGFTFAIFKERLSRRAGWKAKAALLNQELIAGIGNIYSDEILWQAGVHPERLVRDIPADKLRAMWKATREILTRSIGVGGDSLSDYRNAFGEKGGFQHCHNAYRQTGKPCPKKGCRGVIRRVIVGGRSAHFCSMHQK